MDPNYDQESRSRSVPTSEIDRQPAEKKRRLTIEQVNMLEKSFEEDNKLEPERKTELAKLLGLPQRQVAVWFQNRKARFKIKQIERDYDVLKACYDSLLAKHESVISENEKLRSKALTLTKMLPPSTSQTQRNFQVKLNSKGDDETMSSSTALVPLVNDHYFTNVDETFGWWVWPSNLM